MTGLWDLRTNRGYPAVREITATREEMRAGVKAANTMHPEYAPHYATAHPDPGEGEPVETDETMPKEEIDEAIGGF